MTDTALDRRALSLRDVILILGLVCGLAMNYVTLNSRLSVVEAKLDLMQKQLDRIAPPR